MNYFEKKDNLHNLINKQNFTEALRKLISRYLIGTKQDFDFDENKALNLYIVKYEFWKKEITEDNNFEKMIYDICPSEITIANCKTLYDLLEGDKYNIIEEEKEENRQKAGKEEEIKRKEEDYYYGEREES